MDIFHSGMELWNIYVPDSHARSYRGFFFFFSTAVVTEYLDLQFSNSDLHLVSWRAGGNPEDQVLLADSAGLEAGEMGALSPLVVNSSLVKMMVPAQEDTPITQLWQATLSGGLKAPCLSNKWLSWLREKCTFCRTPRTHSLRHHTAHTGTMKKSEIPIVLQSCCVPSVWRTLVSQPTPFMRSTRNLLVIPEVPVLPTAFLDVAISWGRGMQWAPHITERPIPLYH